MKTKLSSIIAGLKADQALGLVSQNLAIRIGELELCQSRATEILLEGLQGKKDLDERSKKLWDLLVED